MDTVSYPWERYGMIVELATRMQPASPQFGKTALQKMIYLLQTVYGVKCGYDYSFHTYGPYSSDLSRDLQIIQYHGGLEISFVNTGTWGYLIKPGPQNELFREKAASFIGQVESNLDAAIIEFGANNARDLELISTIIYTDRDLENDKKQYSRIQFIRLIHDLKPQFEQRYIDTVVAGLEDKCFIGKR